MRGSAEDKSSTFTPLQVERGMHKITEWGEKNSIRIFLSLTFQQLWLNFRYCVKIVEPFIPDLLSLTYISYLETITFTWLRGGRGKPGGLWSACNLKSFTFNDFFSG